MLIRKRVQGGNRCGSPANEARPQAIHERNTFLPFVEGINTLENMAIQLWYETTDPMRYTRMDRPTECYGLEGAATILDRAANSLRRKALLYDPTTL